MSHSDDEGVAPVKSERKSNPQINSGRWTREEHAMFVKGLEKHGKEWKRIAEMIETRTVVQIRTHAQKYFQKVAKSTGGPVMSTSRKGDTLGKSRGQSSDGEGDYDLEHDVLDPPPAKKKAAGGRAGTRSGSADARKPNSIRVPSFQKPNGRSSLRIDSKNDSGGGITPRTMAAATILLRPRIQHKMQTGGDTPKTREQASWLASHQEHAAQILGKRRRGTPQNNGGPSSSDEGEPQTMLSWDTAAAATQN